LIPIVDKLDKSLISGASREDLLDISSQVRTTKGAKPQQANRSFASIAPALGRPLLTRCFASNR
jgi:hypothetical protein